MLTAIYIQVIADREIPYTRLMVPFSNHSGCVQSTDAVALLLEVFLQLRDADNAEMED